MGEFHKIGKVPNKHRPRHVPRPLCNVANSENYHENLTFTLTTKEKSCRKIANSKYDLLDIEMNECLGEVKAGIQVNLNKTRKVPHECISACSDSMWF